jgi:transcriptional regulator with XRE-family HTH domain
MKSIDNSRSYISKQVRVLRHERRWTQAELARRLGLSQSRLSEIEGGRGSFTAEQFLLILKLFNVPASRFGGETRNREAETQNALARLGAHQLQESEDVLPSDERDIGDVVRDALVDGHPRLVTSLAVVLVRHVERLNLKRIQLDLVETGASGRLPWLVQNTLEAAAEYLSTVSVPKRWARRLRRAQVLLSPFLESSTASRDERRESPILDVLDPTIRSKQTVEEVRAESSNISQHWGVVTRLQLQDFIEALKAIADE